MAHMKQSDIVRLYRSYQHRKMAVTSMSIILGVLSVATYILFLAQSDAAWIFLALSSLLGCCLCDVWLDTDGDSMLEKERKLVEEHLDDL